MQGCCVIFAGLVHSEGKSHAGRMACRLQDLTAELKNMYLTQRMMFLEGGSWPRPATKPTATYLAHKSRLRIHEAGSVAQDNRQHVHKPAGQPHGHMHSFHKDKVLQES